MFEVKGGQLRLIKPGEDVDELRATNTENGGKISFFCRKRSLQQFSYDSGKFMAWTVPCCDSGGSEGRCGNSMPCPCGTVPML